MAWPAHAGESRYEGAVTDATGEVDFVVKRKNGNVRIKDFHADQLTWTCATETRKANFGIRGIEVRRRRFSIEKQVGGLRGSDFAEVEGRLRRGGKASGTIRFRRGFDQTPICDTGVLEWKAST